MYSKLKIFNYIAFGVCGLLYFKAGYHLSNLQLMDNIFTMGYIITLVIFVGLVNRINRINIMNRV